MSDAESTGAAAKTTLVVETTTIVVETTHPAAAGPTANDDLAPTTADDAAPTSVSNGAGAVATAAPNAPDTTTPTATVSTGARAAGVSAPSQATTNVAALMARRFRGFLPVVVDVETGGFHSSTDALLEIAAVLIDMEPDGTLKRGATLSFHVKPFEGARLDPAALAITGIDPFHPQ